MKWVHCATESQSLTTSEGYVCVMMAKIEQGLQLLQPKYMHRERNARNIPTTLLDYDQDPRSEKTNTSQNDMKVLSALVPR